MYAGEQEVLIIDAAGEDVVWADRDHAALLVRAVNYSEALVDVLKRLSGNKMPSDEATRDARELLKRIEAN